MRHRIAPIALVVLALVAAGCGGGGKGKGGAQLVGSVAETRAYYQILDLASGTVTPVGSLTLTDPTLKTTKMAFRLINAATPTLGSPSGSGVGTFAADSDETQHGATLRNYYLAVFETTQAQWTALGGAATAWSTALPGADVQIGATYPAVGITASVAASTLAAYNASRAYRMRLPTEDEWEYACRAGTATAYSWGDVIDNATVTAHARVWETMGATRGAAAVGSLASNPWGFYDMHGNAWELCADGVPRGGSWNDPVTLARSANRLAIATGAGASTPALEPDTAHLLVGVRLVYVP